MKDNKVTYFDSFGVEYIPKEVEEFIKDKKVETNIIRIKKFDSIICRYFCILLIDYMLKGKTLNDFSNLFSPSDFLKNDKIILNYFK